MGPQANCPACGKAFQYPAHLAGQAVICPNCRATVIAPAIGPSQSQAPPRMPQSPQTFPNQQGAGTWQATPTQMPGGGLVFVPMQRPHRGGLILTLGILGLLCCGPLAIAAWIMGASDLKEMDGGLMDGSGRGSTMAGMILGIIGTVFMVLGILYFLIVFFAAAIEAMPA